MGLLWWRNKDSESMSGSGSPQTNEPSSTMSEDLTNFLESKESQLSNREFKSLLRRQSENSNAVKKEQESGGVDTGANFLSMIQGKPAENGDQENQKVGEEAVESLKLPSSISTTKSMAIPKKYVNYELEKYQRENNEKESILTNCSEIQHKFYNCLGKQKIWDRLNAVATLKNDECTNLSEFFIACTEIQKKAFLLYDYSSLNDIEEMKSASRDIDFIFTRNFSNIDDVQDKEKFLNYTKELRVKREEFFNKFNK